MKIIWTKELDGWAIPNEGFKIRNYVLGIEIIRDKKNKLLALSQASYIDTVLACFAMQNSKKCLLPTRHGIIISRE